MTSTDNSAMPKGESVETESVETESVETVVPIRSGERVHLIDSFRGFAILGILIVNMMLGFSHPIPRAFSRHTPGTGLDLWADLFIGFFAQGKFILIFAFLFGLGMAVQMERCKATSRPFVPFFTRRMLCLLLIGLIHGVFLWSGDVLVSYALTGLVLLLFRNRTTKGLFIWVSLLWSLVLIGAAIFFVYMKNIEGGLGRIMLDVAATDAQNAAFYARSLEAVGRGSYADATGSRIQELAMMYSFIVPQILMLLVPFLAGVFVWRKRYFQDVAAHKKIFKRVLLYVAPFGLMGTYCMTLTSLFELVGADAAMSGAAAHIGMFGMSATYLSALALAYEAGYLKRMFASLAAVGRMALTNYLTHSLVLTFIFNGYGLGLMGKISDFTGLMLSFVVFILQVFFSRWWLSQYRFGPMEWVWRSLTYGKLQAMRRIVIPG